jgi:signal transduction histidine kinase
LERQLAQIQSEFSADSASLWIADPDRKTTRCVLSLPRAESARDARTPGGRIGGQSDDSFLLRALALPGEPLVVSEPPPLPASGDANGSLSAQLSPCYWLIAALDVPSASCAIALSRRGWKAYSEAESRRAQFISREFAPAVCLALAAAEDVDSSLDAERNRMARELHDTLGQGFAAILIQLEVFEGQLRATTQETVASLDRARKVARESLADARRAIRALRPRALDSGDLAGALDRWIRELGAGVGARLEFSSRGRFEYLSENIKADLLHVAQQAVTNALHHGGAERVRVKLVFSHGRIALTVDDNGGGVAQPKDPQRSGFGLEDMRERVQGLGGEFGISSRAGHGTRVRVLVPVPEDARHGR